MKKKIKELEVPSKSDETRLAELASSPRASLEGRLYQPHQLITGNSSVTPRLSPRPPSLLSATSSTSSTSPRSRRPSKKPFPFGRRVIHASSTSASASPPTSKLSSPKGSSILKLKSQDGGETTVDEEMNRIDCGTVNEEKGKEIDDSKTIERLAGRDKRYKSTFKSFSERLAESGCKGVGEESTFLYLKRKEGGTGYDLVECGNDRGENCQDYYIFSSSGITTQYGNGTTEFTTLEQFEREFYMYSQIKEVRFFKQYRMWKSFCDWKNNVRHKKIALCKARLQERLFILHPLLRMSLLKLRKLCHDAAGYRLFHVHPSKTYELEEFSRAQKDQREAVKGHLDRFFHEIRQLLLHACNNALRHFLEENGFARKPNKKDELEIHRGVEEPRAITFTERAAMRTQCRKLAKYIRLVDFLVIDTMLGLASTSTAEFLASISSRQSHSRKGGNHAPSPVFLVKLNADIDPHSEYENSEEEQLVNFHPTAEDFRLETETIIFDTLKVVTDPEPLLDHADFALFAQPSLEENGNGGERIDLEMMIVEDQHFQTMIEDISSCLRSAFEKANQFCQTFEPYLEQYIKNERLYAQLSVENYKSKPLEDFQVLLQTYATQQNVFDSMPTESSIGLVRIESSALKNLFVPSPVRCLMKLKELIPEIMRLKSAENLKEMRFSNDNLSRVTYSVDEFVDQLSFLRSVSEDIETIDHRFEFAANLYRLCLDYHVDLEEEDNTNVYMLKETNKALHASIQSTEDGISENTARFAKELEEQIPRLRSRVGNLRTQLGHVMIFNPDANAMEVIDYLSKIQQQIDEVQALRERYTKYQRILGVPISTYDDLDEVKSDLSIKFRLWQANSSWDTLSQHWCDTLFCEVDPTAILAELEKYLKIAVQAERSLQGNLVAPALHEKVLDFKRTMPVVTALRCKDLCERHWERIDAILGYQVNGVKDLQLGHLIKRRAMDYCDEIESIATEAVQEAVLLSMIDKVDNKWKTAEFAILPFKETKDHIIGGVDEIIVELDESLVIVNTVLGSRYVKHIRELVDDWHHKLVLFQETLEEWLTCQRNWMYLESIFSAPDIQRQLPHESKMFGKVDSSFRENMRRTADDPNCLKCCTRAGLKETLQKHNMALEDIQKSLEDYLETKRGAFARFYFLSNDELLEILAQTKDPHAVQPHLRKCFDALVALEFGDQPKSIDIKAMISPEGERIELGKNLKARGNVEDWLTAVESNMKSSLQKLMKVGLFDYFEKSRMEWVRSHPGQIVATVAQIAWVLGTECAIRNQHGLLVQDHVKKESKSVAPEATLSDPRDASPHEDVGQSSDMQSEFVQTFFDEHVSSLEAWYKKNVEELDKLTQLVRSDLTKKERKIIVALVTTDVHARDIVETLWKQDVVSVQNFTWQQQLRYYWQKEEIDDCVVRQSNSAIRYAYEYEGCTSRLVITPLTDRCWMTLTGALHLKLGGSPSGPAGTGKTESSKDLAKALGIQCIVFNCSDQIDYKMMAKLFSGLAQAGCWTCLDEFNRIEIEVLSVVAQQLLTLRQGRLAQVQTIRFEGREIALKDHHVIITMNPGYAGRTELPDNLKVLFRPVAMMVPDYSLIAEIMLFAEGFSDAKTLSVKMTKMYSLASEQLSQQCHYDYGLRAVKSVLVMAGGLKRGNPHLSEDVVLIRAMRDSNLPKFLKQDVPLFFGILADLFPDVTVPYQDTGELQETIERVLGDKQLQLVPAFIKKIIQLYETMNVRFGVTIVGPTGGGKTTAYQTLAESLTDLFNKYIDDAAKIPYRAVFTNVLNPKCITMGELYGEFNELTQEWTDGLASSIMRAQVASETDDSKWIVFDGPIDALWIENMNTVLDDNMTLCLANGERIKLKTQMKCVFEVQDLEVASPATVSRLGVLYMTPDDLGWLPVIQTWLQRDMAVSFGAEAGLLQERILNCVKVVFEQGLHFIRCHASEPIPTVDVQLAATFCGIFESLFASSPFLRTLKDSPQRPELKERLTQLVDRIMAFGFIWSLGGALDDGSQEGFDDWARKEFDKSGLGLIGLSAKGLVFDYFVDIQTEQFRKWDDVVPEFKYSTSTPFSQLLVPTMDTVRYSFLVEKMWAIQKPCFLTGVTGTGKTVILQNLLRELAKSDQEEEKQLYEEEGQTSAAAIERKKTAARLASLGLDSRQVLLPIHIGFSAQTSSKVTQLSIESKLEKKRKTLLGAPAGQTAVVFVDDVNMPMVEEYGAQPPIELLRQLLDFKGFYDRQKLFFKEIQDTVLTVAAAPPGGGRNPVTPRFVRHFCVLCLPLANKVNMQAIFSGILSGFLAEGFQADIKSLVKPVVESTIDVYFRISQHMLPTPRKSHYTFNLRDLSKVIQGILMIRPQRCQSTESFTKLWVHESLRVFHDRLINIEDKDWFTDLVIDLLKRNFHVDWTKEETFGTSPAAMEDTGGKKVNAKEVPPLLFVDFLRGLAELDADTAQEVAEANDDARQYEQVASFQQIAKVLEDALDDYNIAFPSKMNLVFFADAVDHVSRISRILRQKRGNAMLVGVGGSGKQSLSRLAMFMSGTKCVQIEITKGYGSADFREDLKTMMVTSGVKGHRVGFLLTDSQIISDSFLEDINNILNSGEVPNLFAQDEMDRIIADIAPVLKAKGIPETLDNCKQMFVNRVRDNLHVVLCMSPVGDSLRIWCRQFPSLINCCTIDWFLEWPQSALNSVAKRFLSSVELPSEECRESLVKACAIVHTSITEASERFLQELGRTVYTTPKSYLDLIELYISMLQEKRGEKQNACERLSSGIVKLKETNEMVQQLKKELSDLMPVLEAKSKDAEALLKQVAKEQAEASEVKAKVAKEEAEVNEKAAQVADVQADAQKDLDKAMPALNDAIKSLDALDKKDITEMKSFAKPPAAVQTVMEAVNVLLGEKADWDTAKKILGENKFMDNLKNFDKDNIPAATLKKLKKYVEDPIMSVENVKKVSKAATSLCMWVHAMDVYSVVAKEVEPKRQRLHEMNVALEDANAVLAEKRAALQAVVDKVNALQATCDETLSEKTRLANEAQKTRARLDRAEKLTTGLASEGIRWQESVQILEKQIENLVGDMFLASACVSYYGAFTGTYREDLVGMWQGKIKALGIPCSSEMFSLVKTIGDPVTVREWQICGLPTDDVSTNNALLATRGKRWPLMIDPQMQANKWIKQKEAKAGLEVVKMSDPNMLRILETAVRNGKPLLVEDTAEQMDPGLEPILQKAVFKQGGRTLIRLGDSDVDYDPNFQLYMTTKIPNPHYLPEVCIKVTLINFTVTMEGLEDQLLGTVVRTEKPDIEERKNRLLLSMAADQKQLKDIEDKILRMLSEAKGNILDDEELINTLADSKTTSAIITERVQESEKTNVEVNTMRNSYRPIARRGSIIYFVVADLARIDPMYQYSLEYFVKLFQRCLDDSEKSDDLATRLETILEFQNYFVFKNVCRGLFEVHKLLFAFLITVQIRRNAEVISDVEWNLFLRGPMSLMSYADGEDAADQPLPPGMSKSTWLHLCVLDELMPHQFQGICSHVLRNWEGEGGWREWALSEQPHNTPTPAFQPFQDNRNENPDEDAGPTESGGEANTDSFTLSHFQKLILVKAFREEKVIYGIRSFVIHELGQKFVQSPSSSMDDISKDMDNKTPCIFVLSQGADPTSLLLRFAEKRDYLERLHVISLGQGQGVKAEKLIQDAMVSGDWVLLQNCHLAKSWMPSLEAVIANFHEPGTCASMHSDFRLFLTSFPAVYFPVSVLQNGVKLTNEPPRGLQANISRSFETVLNEDILESCGAKPKEFRKILFGLCFFHGIIQERRKFGPLGWNIRYEFDDSDLETSAQQLRRFLDESGDGLIPWDAIHYVTGQINYGGRVTDDWDRRCLMSILSRFYCPGILEDEYKFSKSGVYFAPKDTDKQGYLSYIRSLPDIEDTEVFGLHPNANITLELQESMNILDAVLSIQPRASGGAGIAGQSPDEIVKAMAMKMEAELPEALDIEKEAGPSTFVMNEETQLLQPLATFLLQEVAKFNRLLEAMKSSLNDLAQAIDGRIVMSSALDKMHTSFFNGAVPELWSAVAYPSLRPINSWFADFKERFAFIRAWLRNGQPKVFRLPVFFFPQGFLTGVLQTHARKHKVAINSLSFDFEVYNCLEEDVEITPEDGVIVSGLFMEGARWDAEAGLLQDSNPREMYCAMRPIHFLPAEDFVPDVTKYSCPVYKTSKRAGALSTTGMSTNFVLAVHLPTDRDPDDWIWRGVAFLLNLND